MASLLLKLVLKELESRSNHVETNFSFITQLGKLDNISIQLVILKVAAKDFCVWLGLPGKEQYHVKKKTNKNKKAKQYAILDSVGA